MLQIDIFGNEVEAKEKKPVDKAKRRWENGFQRWSNEMFNDGSTPLGKCGYGEICHYCEDYSYGRPCVRALNRMCREKGITIDYENTKYEEMW